MVRRTSRRKLLPDDAELEEGWIRHDGGKCPVAPDDRPAVFFRIGGPMKAGVRAASYWDEFGEGSRWEWRGRRPGYYDILGYRFD